MKGLKGLSSMCLMIISIFISRRSTSGMTKLQGLSMASWVMKSGRLHRENGTATMFLLNKMLKFVTIALRLSCFLQCRSKAD